MKGVCENQGVHAESAPVCTGCGGRGDTLYKNLRDRLFAAPGIWNLRKCPNTACGLIWLDPRPVAEDIGKLYQEYYTHQEPEAAPGVNAWHHRLYRRVNEVCEKTYLAQKYGYEARSLAPWMKLLGGLIHIRPAFRADLDFRIMYLRERKASLLDVGCGSGHALKRMQDLGWCVEGVDLDPTAVQNAQRKGLQVRQGTLEAQRYPDNHFDAIAMSHLIEHVHDPLQLLRECHRICKAGGHLVVVTPNSGSWGHALFGDAWLALDPPRHLHVFSLPSLRGLVEKAGFHRQAISTTIRAADWAFAASMSIERTGKYVWASAQPRHAHLWARCLQIAEWAILMVNPGIGEEIVLMAEKS